MNKSSGPRGDVAPAADDTAGDRRPAAGQAGDSRTAAGHRRPRAVALGIGCAVLVGTFIWVATFPISI